MVTSCFPKDFNFSFVMTKGAYGFSRSRHQCYETSKYWSELEKSIENHWNEGYNITTLSYSDESKEYIAVLTESEQSQYYTWGDSNCRDGYTPTIIFQDPSDGEILYVKTKNVNNVGDWIVRSDYSIE